MVINLIVGSIKKIILHKMIYFAGPYDHKRNKIKIDLIFSNYASKSDLKLAPGVHTSKSVGLAGWKPEIDN